MSRACLRATPHEIAEVKRLAAARISQQRIADAIGRSQGFVWGVLNPEAYARQIARKQQRREAELLAGRA